MIDSVFENPVRPELGDDRLAQLRAHLLDEVGRSRPKRSPWTSVRSFVTRRRLLVAVVAGLIGAYSVPAVAQEEWWWMTPGSDLEPVSAVVTVTRTWADGKLSLRAGGHHWLLQAFVDKRHGLCVGLGPDPPLPANFGWSMTCGQPVVGIPRPGRPPREAHWVGVLAGTQMVPGPDGELRPGPKDMYGIANERVRRVDLENLQGQVVSVPTIEAPDELGVRARFWVVVLPNEHLVHTVVPRDEDGKALEHWRLPWAH